MISTHIFSLREIQFLLDFMQQFYTTNRKELASGGYPAFPVRSLEEAERGKGIGTKLLALSMTADSLKREKKKSSLVEVNNSLRIMVGYINKEYDATFSALKRQYEMTHTVPVAIVSETVTKHSLLANTITTGGHNE